MKADLHVAGIHTALDILRFAIFFLQNFGTKFIWTKKILHIFFQPTHIGLDQYFLPTFFSEQILFELSCFWDQLFFGPIFFGQDYLHEAFLDQIIF